MVTQPELKRLYKSEAWQRLRLHVLNTRPLCAYCADNGRVTGATVVDHITPHKGDRGLFYNLDNLQPLCKPCHDRDKQSLDHQQAAGLGQADADGYPTTGDW